jgi:hypothetical protein
MRIYRLGPLNFLVRLSGGNVEPVDLALVNVPDDFAPLWQHITPLNGIELELPRSILATSLLDTPATGVRYGFAGIVHVERTDGALYGDSKCENDLTFVMEDDIWYHFALNHPHPGDNEYKGCSGAPVMDAGGNLVALLVGRSLVVPDGIRAVPLARYRAAIDLSLGLDPE